MYNLSIYDIKNINNNCDCLSDFRVTQITISTTQTLPASFLTCFRFIVTINYIIICWSRQSLDSVID